MVTYNNFTRLTSTHNRRHKHVMHNSLCQAQTHRTIEIHLVLTFPSASVHLVECNLLVVIEPENIEDKIAATEDARDLLILDNIKTLVNIESGAFNATQLELTLTKPNKQKVTKE